MSTVQRVESYGVIRRGMTGQRVLVVQHHLKNHGFDIVVDGDFGPATERAVKEFQARVGLVVDGLVGSKTLTYLGNKTPKRPLLSEADLEWAASELDVDLAVIKTISRVESRGRGFVNDDKPAILYERHIMARRLRAKGINVDRWQDLCPNIVNTSPGGHKGGSVEWDRMALACVIDPTTAYESASWGVYQIMGFHWESLGYASVDEFVDAMESGERAHLEALVRFIKCDEDLHVAMQRLDWDTWAGIYNGPNYRNNGYHIKLQNAYQSVVDGA